MNTTNHKIEYQGSIIETMDKYNLTVEQVLSDEGMQQIICNNILNNNSILRKMFNE